MDGNLWNQVYQLVMSTDYPNLTRRATHSDRVVALIQLRAALGNISISRATQPESWIGLKRPQTLPSQPTMSRRLRKPGVTALLAAVEERLRQTPVEAPSSSPQQTPVEGAAASTTRGHRWPSVGGQ